MSIRSKYRRAYHYLKACDAIDDLRNRHIKLSVYGAVNDEHELKAYTLWGLGDSDDIARLFAEHYTFLCFVRKSNDEYMWKEYADGSRGICLGFDVRSSRLSPIEYLKEPVTERFPPELLAVILKQTSNYTPEFRRGQDYLKLVILTKFADLWAREEEWRVFASREEEENGLYFAKIGTQGVYLQEVILGRHCAISDEETRVLVCDYPRGPIVVRRQAQPRG